ncbi:MAG: amidohydrolase [Actinomycetota bacterium]|nr:amidohydrolase [Actinomycetota bacterium]
MTADLVLHNGVVHTLDPALIGASAIALGGGRILAVGDEATVREHVSGNAESIDLGGRTVLAGFQDGHVHASGAGIERNRCNLTEAHSRQEYLDTVARYAKAHPDAAWITGGGWSMDVFPGGVPTKEDLDRVVPDRPVLLFNRDHHGAWANSVALERAGIDARTPDPVDGRIERDAKGEPVGMLQEGASDLVGRHIPELTTEEIAAGILEGQRYLHSFGITAWQEAIVGESPVVGDCFDAFLALDRAGLLTGKVVGAQWWPRGADETFISTLLDRREQASKGSHFRADSVKFMQDGICENFTAAMLTPYLDRAGHETHNCGKSFFSPEELTSYVTLVDAHGFQAHFHAIGDRAVREVLDAAEAARAANGTSDRRHCAAHIQVVHPDDISRFAQVGVIANGQPLWACAEPQMVELTLPFLGPERSSWQYPFGSLVRAGARLCFGSDWPVSTPNVLEEVHVAVNRTVPPDHAHAGADGGGTDPLLPSERVDLETAIEAFTAGSAYLNHLEQETGSITPGKRADLVVLDRDLFSVPTSEIALVEVDLTFADGKIVHDRGVL